MSSIDPIRPVSGPPRLKPLRRSEREEEGDQEGRRDDTRDKPERDDDERQKLIDIRA